MPRHKLPPPKPADELIRLNFWSPRGLAIAYKVALAARASALSLDLRAHMGRVVAEHQRIQSRQQQRCHIQKD